MTAPITHRPLRKAGRKPINPPADAAERIRDLAADGFSVIGVSHRMGVGKDTFNRWLDENPELREAFDHGREAERHALHNLLYRQAMEQGNATAAMFLLKARHGYREGDQTDTAGRVAIQINLPGALSLQQFTALSKKEIAALVPAEEALPQ